MEQIAQIPCTPRFIEGIVNVRGRIVSIVDIKQLLGLPKTERSEETRIIVLRSGGTELGFLADELAGVRELPRGDISPPLRTEGGRASFLFGVGEGEIALLDGEKLLRDGALVVNEDI